MRLLYTWICILVTVAAAASGDVFIALAMRRIGDLGELGRRHGFLRVIVRVLSSGVFLSGICFMAIAFFSNLIGLSWADLSLMGPATASLTFLANALGARFFLGEDVDRRRWLATIFVCAGVLLIARS
jgi:drug/metabolite transporter (DMT)-like permease